jgi:hypothetical protein
MKHTRKNKRFSKRKQTKRNNYRKKRPTGGGILSTIGSTMGIGENAAHRGKNGLLLDFNICGNRDKYEKCNNKMQNPGFGYMSNDGFLNTGYNIENGKLLSTVPFNENNTIAGYDTMRYYKGYKIIYDKDQNINENLNENDIAFLTKNNIKILFQIITDEAENEVIIVKSYEKKKYNHRFYYTHVVVDTDTYKLLNEKKVGDYTIIELYRQHGDLDSFRNRKTM